MVSGRISFEELRVFGKAPAGRFETVLLVERHKARCGYVCIQMYDVSAVVDRLTKSAHFLPIRKNYSISKLADRTADGRRKEKRVTNGSLEINKFNFPVDFVVFEIDEDEPVSIILGRPFLATARAVIDVHEGKLSLRVGNETITFNIGKFMRSRYSRDDYLYYADHTMKLVREQWVDTIDHDGKCIEVEEEQDPNEVRALELKELPEHLEYAFLQGDDQLPVVISSALSASKKIKLLEVLRNHKGAITWSIANIKGINSSFCTHKILIEDEFKPTVQPQRRVNPNIKEVVKKEVVKLLNVGLIYPIFDIPWVSPVQVVPKRGDDRGYFQIPITPEDQVKTTFTSLYERIEVFMDDFSIFGGSFDPCLVNLEKMLKRCGETNLVLNWKKYHFMVQEGIFLGHEVSGAGIKDDLLNSHHPGGRNVYIRSWKLIKAEIRDLFLDEQLMKISDKSDEPCYADYANYLTSRVLPFRSTREEKQKFFNNLRHFFWDEPYLFKQCADQIIRRCVSGSEATQILRQSYSGPSGWDHHYGKKSL
nr:hypothetical protein [Tanacetum cinerariifolium]